MKISLPYRSSLTIKGHRSRKGKTCVSIPRDMRENFDYIWNQSIQAVEIVRPCTAIGIVSSEIPNLGTFRFAFQGKRYSPRLKQWNPLDANVVILGGGKLHFSGPELKSGPDMDPLYTRKVANVLIGTDQALEALLMISYSGGLTVDQLVAELVPKERIVEVISELRRCELVEFSGDLVSMAPLGTRIVAKIQAKLDNESYR